MFAALNAVRRSMPRAAWWTICILATVAFLYPVVAMLGMAFKSIAEQGRIPPTLLPTNPSLTNFEFLGNVHGLNVFGNVLNSVAVSVSATLGVVVLSTLAGFALARTKFPGSNIVFFVILATFMIPFQSIMTPLYKVLQALSLNNSLVGLTLVYMTFNMPFALFIMRNSFASIPASIEDAALVDGCNTLQSMIRVLLPIALPGAITAALMTFFASWNEFFAALIFISDQNRYTLPVTLTLISSGQYGIVAWGPLQAGVSLTIIPSILIYVLLQKYYVRGMLSGAIK